MSVPARRRRGAGHGPWSVAADSRARRVLADKPPFAGLRGSCAGAPIVSMELWLDRPVVDRVMVGLRGCEIEWVFDKGRLHGREAAAGQHLAFIVSAAYRTAPRPNAEIVALAEAALRRYFSGHEGRGRHPLARPARAGCDLLLRSGVRVHRPGRRPRSAGSFSPATGRTPGCPPPSRAPSVAGAGGAAARPVTARPVFPIARWIGLAWLAVWVPAYWSFYGPVVFLNLCDIAIILTCVGLWRGSALLLSSQAVSSLVVDFAWCLDLAWRWITAHRLIGGTEYMWDPAYPVWLRPVPVPHRASHRAHLVAASGGLRPTRAPGCRSASRPWCWRRRGRSGRRRTRTSRSPTRCSDGRGVRRPSTWR